MTCPPARLTGPRSVFVPFSGLASLDLANASVCGAAPFTLSPSASWLQLSAVAGTVPAGGTLSVIVTVNASALPSAPGIYTAGIVVSGPSGPFTVPVSTERPTTPPNIASASGTCSRLGANSTFTVVTTGDVDTVVVTIFRTVGNVTIILTKNAANWTGATTFANAAGATGFQAVATGPAGTDTQGFSVSCS